MTGDTHPIDLGDWIEVQQIGGGPPRRGQVTEILGRPGHEHYRVRWDELHESLHFPADGTRVLHETPEGRLVDEGRAT
jgi:hypothetical protein